MPIKYLQKSNCQTTEERLAETLGEPILPSIAVLP